MEAAEQPLRTLLDALAARDFGGVAEVFAPDARFQALLPRKHVDAAGASEAAGWYRTWFGDAEEVTVTDLEVRPVGRVATFRFRALARKPRGWSEIEQTGVCELADGRVAGMRLACSGFQYGEEGEACTLPAAAGAPHRFDAGDLGCGSGLPEAFRERLGEVAVGEVLTVVTRDPSAREDLPALARMLGHTVRSVERGEDGTTMISVERGR